MRTYTFLWVFYSFWSRVGKVTWGLYRHAQRFLQISTCHYCDTSYCGSIHAAEARECLILSSFGEKEPREKCIQRALNLDRCLRAFLILKRVSTNNCDIVFAYFLPGSICCRSAGSFLPETSILFGWYLSILSQLKCTE